MGVAPICVCPAVCYAAAVATARVLSAAANQEGDDIAADAAVCTTQQHLFTNASARPDLPDLANLCCVRAPATDAALARHPGHATLCPERHRAEGPAAADDEGAVSLD
ncbi:hypothetical protein H0H87_002352 [Tephrocybe sp. NHM501043]|nr:hypothetical protein H0H87_002352 [Tephrocybe sp. NHM501043]